MSRQSNPPRYRKHKQSGQAVVTLPDGYGRRRDVVLGKYGTKASREEYGRVIAEWEAAGRTMARAASVADLTIVELVAAYWQHVQDYYRHPDGTATSEVSNHKEPLRRLNKLYGRTAAKDFDSLSLEAIRKGMITDGLCRGRINKDMARLKRLFRWAAAKKLVPVTVHQLLTTVDGLRAGRSAAKETEPVKPVPLAFVEAVLPFALPQVAAIIELQLHAGMRPGEVVIMRSIDLDTSGAVWLYRPGSDQGPAGQHKNAYRGHQRVVTIGPRGQAVLRSWLKLQVEEFLFSPHEAGIAEMQGCRRSGRRR
jgi:integrase